MARVRRLICDNAVYHILNRGHDRRKLFSRPADFKAFKETIAKYKERHSFDLYNYCLMSNHFHLLMKVSKGEDLPIIMKGVCQSYAFYFKKEYRLSGYLFQNRYKSIIIEKDEYLLECARYIERNPVRAGIVEDPRNYYFSSCSFYARGKFDGIITPNPLYLALSAIEGERRNKYIEYVTTPRAYELLIDERMAELK